MRRGAAAAERGARRNNAILRLSMSLRMRQAATHLCGMREALRRVSLRSDVGVGYVGVRRWEAWARLGVVLRAIGEVAIAVVLARCLRGLDAIARLYHIGLERDGSWTAVEFEEEAARVAEDGAGFVAAPEGCRGGCAVLADGLW